MNIFRMVEMESPQLSPILLDQIEVIILYDFFKSGLFLYTVSAGPTVEFNGPQGPPKIPGCL